MRVLHVDDSEPLTALVGFWLEEAEGLESVGAVHDFDRALSAVAAARPDVVVLDTLGTGELPAALPEVRRAAPGVRVLVYSGFPRERVVDPGGSEPDGYLHKGEDEAALINAIRGLGCREGSATKPQPRHAAHGRPAPR